MLLDKYNNILKLKKAIYNQQNYKHQFNIVDFRLLKKTQLNLSIISLCSFNLFRSYSDEVQIKIMNELHSLHLSNIRKYLKLIFDSKSKHKILRLIQVGKEEIAKKMISTTILKSWNFKADKVCNLFAEAYAGQSLLMSEIKKYDTENLPVAVNYLEDDGEDTPLGYLPDYNYKTKLIKLLVEYSGDKTDCLKRGYHFHLFYTGNQYLIPFLHKI